jgi:putative peptide zinc metalloprotease protein
VRLANRPREVLPAVIEQQTPSATRHLPSRVLGSAGGGRIAVDMRETEGRRALERVFQFDLGLPLRPAGHYAVGARVHVRFEHGRESIARRAYLRVRRLLLERFNT